MWFLSTKHRGVWRSGQRTCFGRLEARSGVVWTTASVTSASDGVSNIVRFAINELLWAATPYVGGKGRTRQMRGAAAYSGCWPEAIECSARPRATRASAADWYSSGGIARTCGSSLARSGTTTSVAGRLRSISN